MIKLLVDLIATTFPGVVIDMRDGTMMKKLEEQSQKLQKISNRAGDMWGDWWYSLLVTSGN